MGVATMEMEQDVVDQADAHRDVRPRVSGFADASAATAALRRMVEPDGDGAFVRYRPTAALRALEAGGDPEVTNAFGESLRFVATMASMRAAGNRRAPVHQTAMRLSRITRSAGMAALVDHARSRRWSVLVAAITDAASAADALSAMVAAGMVDHAVVAAALRAGVAEGLDRAPLLSAVHGVAVDRGDAACAQMIVAAMTAELFARPRLDAVPA